MTQKGRPKADIETLAALYVSGPPRRFLPDLIRLVWERKIEPGKVFDLTLPLSGRGLSCDGRAAIKTLLQP
jgi:hypothetical protein